MMITRREFARQAGFGLSVMVSSFASAGCLISASVFDNILTYIGMGLDAFASVAALIPVLGPAAAIVPLVNSGFALLKAAVAEYQAAPAATKATLLGKIKDALLALQDNLAAFVNALPNSSPVLTLAVSLIKIIVGTLAGYAAKLPAAAASTTAALRTIRLRGQAVVPVFRDAKQFKRDFNAEIERGGYKQYELK
jgi:hypothetical protein